MGQSSSSGCGSGSNYEDLGSFPTELVQEDLLRHARIFAEIAALSYEDFVRQMGELNKLSKKCLDSNGKQLVFAVKKGTDSTILWKGTVRIGCVKIDPITSSVETYRLINLAEFLQVFKTLQGHVKCMETNDKKNTSNASSSTSTNSSPYLTASILLQKIDDIDKCKNFDKLTECCICLERKPEVSLPCAHSYCLPCIEQWNVKLNNKTCPICRERLETTDDTWIISDAPDTDEIVAEICSNLEELSQLSPKHTPK